MRKLPIGPEEAFVLSRVDGYSNLGDIASATGLSEERVVKAVERLVAAGAVTYGPAPTPGTGQSQSFERPTPEKPRESEGEGASSGRLSRPVIETQASAVGGSQHPAAALYDPAELDEAVDLDVPKRRAILDLYYRLDSITHYELLKVDPLADKKVIKNAYYEVVGTFHPDKFFGKNLGSFKPKLERLFARLTEAYDVLTRKQSRLDYDQYLATQQRNKDIEQLIVDEKNYAVELERARQRIEQEARLAEHVEAIKLPSSPPSQPPSPSPSLPPPPSQSPPPNPRLTPSQFPPSGQSLSPSQFPPSGQSLSPSQPSPSQPSPSQPSLQAPRWSAGSELANTPSRLPPSPSVSQSFPAAPLSAADAEARRRALARKLTARSTRPPPTPTGGSSSLAPSPTSNREAISTDLRRRYEERVLHARNNQVQQYVTVAEEATEQGNLVSATNALRIAVSLAPDDPVLNERLEEIRERANVALADSLLDQARYEEKHGRWPEAARSYERASLGKHSANVHERVAFCLLEARGDLKTASEHAKQAVNLAPDVATHHLTLARVYLAAGMRQSALAEFERAHKLAPQDGSVQNWIRRIQRGEV